MQCLHNEHKINILIYNGSKTDVLPYELEQSWTHAFLLGPLFCTETKSRCESKQTEKQHSTSKP
jgi:hypothetical protein